MAYDEALAARIRNALTPYTPIEERDMMGGLSFLYHKKMLVGVIHDEMVCRIDPALHEWAVEKTGCRTMDFTKKPMKGWVMVDATGMKSPKALNDWIQLAVAYNAQAKSAKKKSAKKKPAK